MRRPVQLIQQCRALYLATLERLQLPVEDERLQAQHASALEAAITLFAKDRFGNAGSPEITRLQEDLRALIDREFRYERHAALCVLGTHTCVGVGEDMCACCPRTSTCVVLYSHTCPHMPQDPANSQHTRIVQRL